MGDSNPIENVRFYSKDEPNLPFHMNKEKVSPHLYTNPTGKY